MNIPNIFYTIFHYIGKFDDFYKHYKNTIYNIDNG